jgi:hypothetical protein
VQIYVGDPAFNMQWNLTESQETLGVSPGDLLAKGVTQGRRLQKAHRRLA